jgi:hypothetical protein
MYEPTFEIYDSDWNYVGNMGIGIPLPSQPTGYGFHSFADYFYEGQENDNEIIKKRYDFITLTASMLFDWDLTMEDVEVDETNGHVYFLSNGTIKKYLLTGGSSVASNTSLDTNCNGLCSHIYNGVLYLYVARGDGVLYRLNTDLSILGSAFYSITNMFADILFNDGYWYIMDGTNIVHKYTDGLDGFPGSIVATYNITSSYTGNKIGVLAT